MEEFLSKDLVNDILIIDVKNSSATIQHADEFSKIIQVEIAGMRKKIILNLS
jgi:hypothetical protein